jgi:hypothetical protein
LEANNIAFLTSDRTPTHDDVLEGVKNLVIATSKRTTPSM